MVVDCDLVICYSDPVPASTDTSLQQSGVLRVASSDPVRSAGDDTVTESESDESSFPSDAGSVASADSLADLPRDLPTGPWRLYIHSGVL